MLTREYDVSTIGRVVVFRLPARPMFFSYDLAAFDAMLLDLDRCGFSDSVSVVVIEGPTVAANQDEFSEFYEDVFRSRNNLRLNRMLNKYNQLVLAITDLPKLIVFSGCGLMNSQTFNVGLACDYRVVGADLVVDRGYLRYGLVPKGGGVLFLSSLVGRRNALRLLLGESNLRADEALGLGLVDELVAPDETRAAALTAARRFAALPDSTTSGIKRLMNLELRNLADHLSTENGHIQRTVGSTCLEDGVAATS
jgi:2-(1,2-epoxy-1,2-dihydrophenyl)acetyl-CoA isomerase